MTDLRRNFANRDEMAAYLREQFPAAADPDHVSPTRGGRSEALALLGGIDPVKYAATRNYLDGAVTRLSPYIRHGVVSLVEAREAALAKVAHKGEAGKFVNELGWRDYWQRVWDRIGDGVWDDREEWKTGLSEDDYADDLPADILDGATGMVCVDSFVNELYETGYLHNHARMWLAAYVVHWRRVSWRAGAAWFLTHLLDGDEASNNLSWQWVASTFGGKPYFFNRENLEKYTTGVYCRDCPLRGRCDFEGSYDNLERKLFALPSHDRPSRKPQGRHHRGGRRR